MDKFNESQNDNNIKEHKKTFQSDSDFEEEKEEVQNEENDVELEENEGNKKFNDLCKSIVSMSIEEDGNKEMKKTKKRRKRRK